jgi:hypothetical protein
MAGGMTAASMTPERKISTIQYVMPAAANDGSGQIC